MTQAETTTHSAADIDRLTAHVERTLGPRVKWAEWPGGWPGEIELALLDAVFSIRARYGGVRNVVGRWRERPDAGDLNDLNRLARSSPAQLATQLGNRQKVPGGSQTKASAAIAAARNLAAVGATTAQQVDADSTKQRSAYCDVPGLGPVTWSYFLMLLGVPDVKADTMVQRFVASALPTRRLTADVCRHLVAAAAARLEVSPTTLDHAIWDYQRRRRG